ncbi:little elongation complex subunit 2 isoform X1 [Pantherophis guttatus]|uniref:Little elongation complex subunit 2 isoform X1 n=2 Tax=Pantherophis guttatus TaxID=94885 RepID=A0A6P9B2X1_PANGU|nr:little elongation complex subunit 2 isoform X1 [Pantherophis guttatus]
MAAAAAPAWTALSWDIPPQNGHDVYFSRDLYEKYSLAPTLSELMSFSKRPLENKAAPSHSGPEKQQQPAQETAVKTEPSVAPPQEPRVPYPYVSSLSEKEQRRYLFLLSEYLNADPKLLAWSQQRNYTQYLQMKEFVSKEVAEFLKFARNAARSCAKDYSDISEDALLYTKDFLSARMGCVKNYPEWYSLHEVTSLMGGRFSRELTLKFEKSLLALGMVHLVKRFFPKLPTSINLPADQAKHERLCGTPEHRAAQLHNDISTDPNAEKLAAKYCPQVVLTGESLYTLLNNHGLDYKQQWELPVSVKTVSLAGLKPVKVAYINPPLPKKEMSVREKNQFFHEFLADFHMTKQSSIVSRAVILDKPSEELPGAELKTCPGRPSQESVSADLDFDTDVTKLESFASATRPLSASLAEVSPAKPAGLSAVFSEHLKMEKGQEGRRRSKAKDQETDFSSRKASASGKSLPDLDSEGNSSGEAFDLMETDPDGRSLALAKEKNVDCNILIASPDKNYNISEGTAEDVRSPALSCSSDTDGEHLIIDAEREPGHTSQPGVVPSNPSSPSPSPGEAFLSEKPAESSETHAKTSPCKLRPRLSQKIDPLGQILKMQTKLLKPPSPNSQGHLLVTSERSLNPTQGQADAPSLPLASSVVEPGQTTVTNAGTASKFTWATYYQGPQKGMLWDAVEETASYEPPQHGNLVYKLYSLDDMLLLVRTTIQKVELRPHQKKAKFRRHFPVYVLPKLEYQAFYGVETLTEDEVCRLWTESLLHSNTSFTVGHIDALTSQLFLLERLTGKALKRRFGTFNPTNSLHILQNILKKVAGLQEGSFLLTHLAGDSSVSIYKSSDGIATRAMYNLHAAHADLPPAPAALSVPWVPLDPNIPLPHHFAQGRVPCTFPPVPDKGARTTKMSRKAKAFPGTPSHRGPISTESRDGSLQAEPPRKKRGAAQKPANQGPNRKFWKKKRLNQAT